MQGWPVLPAQVWVPPGHRGHGVGWRLGAEAARVARVGGCQLLEVMTAQAVATAEACCRRFRAKPGPTLRASRLDPTPWRGHAWPRG